MILLTASGARFGFRRTIPHIAGVVVGVGVIAAVAGLGIGATLRAVPGLELALKLVAAAWIGVMAIELWRSSKASERQAVEGRPFTFVQAVLFQWINAKVWVVAVAAAAGYPAGLPPVAEAARLAAAFSGLNLFVCLFWSASGAGLGLLLTQPAAWRVFARVMACLLAASAVLIFL